MAYDVTSQWDDIHRKLGNYEELQKEKTQAEFSKEAIEQMEGYDAIHNLKDEDIEEMEDDLDEEFMREYTAKRLKELEEHKKQPKFEGIREITRQDYIDEVTNAPKGTHVVLHLYQNSVEVCELMNRALFEASEKYKHIKFLKIVSTKCIENYPDSNVPTLVVYLNGNMLATLPRLDKKYRKLTLAAIEDMLQSLNIISLPDSSAKDAAQNYKSRKLLTRIHWWSETKKIKHR
jgi:hypothetical protein